MEYPDPFLGPVKQVAFMEYPHLFLESVKQAAFVSQHFSYVIVADEPFTVLSSKPFTNGTSHFSWQPTVVHPYPSGNLIPIGRVPIAAGFSNCC